MPFVLNNTIKINNRFKQNKVYIYSNSVETYRAKTILYHTTMDDVNTLNYNIDCSTF